jgi:hypothetical protein
MRDAYWLFGTVALGAVSGTKVYCPNPVDTGALSTGTRFTRKHIGAGCSLRVVGQNLAAMESIDSFCMFVCDDADNSGTYTEILRSEVSAAGAAAYTRMVVNLPESHLSYVNVGFIGTSSGTLTTKNCEAWLEDGPNISQGNL